LREAFVGMLVVYLFSALAAVLVGALILALVIFRYY